MKRLKRAIGYFKFSNLSDTIKNLGFAISFRNILIMLLVLAFSTFLVGYLLGLEYIYCAILILFYCLCLPSLIVTKFKADYEKNRFNDTVDYMEQLIYSFHKSNKIREALVDVYGVAHGNVKATIRKMLDCIDFDMTTPKLYEKAFKIMQDEYNCSRMEILHNYLVEVEGNGGECSRSLNILLEDIRSWSRRINTYQQERRNIKSKVTMSIFLAMTSCGIMIHLIPTEYSTQIRGELLYQIGTLLVLMLCLGLYVLATNRVSISYLDYEVDGDSDSLVISSMNYITEYNKRNHVKPAIIKLCIFVPFIIAAIIMNVMWAILPVSLLCLLCVFQPVLKKNNAIRRTIREVTKTFPMWIRNLVLYLQTDNVHVAIKKSYETAPAVLKGEVLSFIRNLEKDPSSIRPYMEFLKDYNVPNLKMSVHYLYSLAQFGNSDMLAQLDYLIEQNGAMTITEEKMRNEDALAGFGTLTLAPMLFAVIKLILDLVLFLNIFMEYMNSFGTIVR